MFAKSLVATVPVLLLAIAVSAIAVHAAEQTADPYPLDKCVLSGKALADVESPVVVNHEGREVKFCCNGCKGKFENDPAGILSKIDAAEVEQQKGKYPLDVCIVSGHKIDGSEGEPVDYVYNNRLFRLCCADCEGAVKKEPAVYFGKLNAAVLEKQGAAYAAKKCPVSGEDLGSMGEPVNIVIGNQLVKLCCKGCEKKLMSDPAKFMAKAE